MGALRVIPTEQAPGLEPFTLGTLCAADHTGRDPAVCPALSLPSLQPSPDPRGTAETGEAGAPGLDQQPGLQLSQAQAKPT